MLLYLGRQRALDADVSPSPGALANFYVSGTTTRQDTYTNATHTIPHQNPVVADDYGFFPPIYLDPALTYKYVITDRDGAALPDGTVDPVVQAALDQGAIGAAIYPLADQETAAGVTPVNKIYPLLHVFRYMTPAQIEDVLERTLLIDVRAAIQTAVTVAQQIGGTVYCPAGSYLIRRVAGDDSEFNGIHIPYTGVFSYDEHMVLRGDGRATVFLAGDNSMTVIRLSDSRTKLADFAIDANGKTGVTGLGLLSSDTTQQLDPVEHIDWNIIEGLDIVGCAEGIQLECPSGGGCYWNRFERMRLYNNTRHIRYRDNATSGGANRNLFLGCNVVGGNTGIWIDGADTNAFINVSFELIAVGTSPLAVPTAIYINNVGTLFGLSAGESNIVACYTEDCTRDLDCSNRRTSIIGGNIGATGNVLLAATPDVWLGGDGQHRLRNVLMGDLAADGLHQSPRAIAFTACPQVATSANTAGSYPFNDDGNLFFQGRQTDGGSVGILTGPASTRRFSISGLGHALFSSADVSFGQSGSAAVVTNGATITTAFQACARINPAGAVTGLILEAGSQPGQMVVVINESANSATFAAAGTSNVADGTSSVVAALRSAAFYWDTATARWYRAS